MKSAKLVQIFLTCQGDKPDA